jgi:hypothetical protein
LVAIRLQGFASTLKALLRLSNTLKSRDLDPISRFILPRLIAPAPQLD